MTTPDTDIVLIQGEYALVTSPYGASLRGLTHAGLPVITGYAGAEGKVGGQGDVLIPFPGRVGGGRYAFGGQNYQMEVNDKDGPNAIHGFLRTKMWDITAHAADAVSYEVVLAPDEHPGYPFSLRAEVAYRLTLQGMTCSFRIVNTGGSPAPVAAGFHPYFTVGSDTIDTDTLHVPFSAVLEFDPVLIPTGRILPAADTPYDFRAPRPIRETSFNTCYVQPIPDADGQTRVTLTDPQTARAITVSLDSAFPCVVLYSGDPLPSTHRRRALAIEPMTCTSDSFNHPEWGLAILAPSQSLSGAWAVSVS